MGLMSWIGDAVGDTLGTFTGAADAIKNTKALQAREKEIASAPRSHSTATPGTPASVASPAHATSSSTPATTISASAAAPAPASAPYGPQIPEDYLPITIHRGSDEQRQSLFPAGQGWGFNTDFPEMSLQLEATRQLSERQRYLAQLTVDKDEEISPPSSGGTGTSTAPLEQSDSSPTPQQTAAAQEAKQAQMSLLESQEDNISTLDKIQSGVDRNLRLASEGALSLWGSMSRGVRSYVQSNDFLSKASRSLAERKDIASLTIKEMQGRGVIQSEIMAASLITRQAQIEVAKTETEIRAQLAFGQPSDLVAQQDWGHRLLQIPSRLISGPDDLRAIDIAIARKNQIEELGAIPEWATDGVVSTLRAVELLPREGAYQHRFGQYLAEMDAQLLFYTRGTGINGKTTIKDLTIEEFLQVFPDENPEAARLSQETNLIPAHLGVSRKAALPPPGAFVSKQIALASTLQDNGGYPTAADLDEQWPQGLIEDLWYRGFLGDGGHDSNGGGLSVALNWLDVVGASRILKGSKIALRSMRTADNAAHVSRSTDNAVDAAQAAGKAKMPAWLGDSLASVWGNVGDWAININSLGLEPMSRFAVRRWRLLSLETAIARGARLTPVQELTTLRDAVRKVDNTLTNLKTVRGGNQLSIQNNLHAIAQTLDSMGIKPPGQKTSPNQVWTWVALASNPSNHTQIINYLTKNGKSLVSPIDDQITKLDYFLGGVNINDLNGDSPEQQISTLVRLLPSSIDPTSLRELGESRTLLQELHYATWNAQQARELELVNRPLIAPLAPRDVVTTGRTRAGTPLPARGQPIFPQDSLSFIPNRARQPIQDSKTFQQTVLALHDLNEIQTLGGTLSRGLAAGVSHLPGEGEDSMEARTGGFLLLTVLAANTLAERKVSGDVYSFEYQRALTLLDSATRNAGRFGHAAAFWTQNNGVQADAMEHHLSRGSVEAIRAYWGLDKLTEKQKGRRLEEGSIIRDNINGDGTVNLSNVLNTQGNISGIGQIRQGYIDRVQVLSVADDGASRINPPVESINNAHTQLQAAVQYDLEQQVNAAATMDTYRQLLVNLETWAKSLENLRSTLEGNNGDGRYSQRITDISAEIGNIRASQLIYAESIRAVIEVQSPQ